MLVIDDIADRAEDERAVLGLDRVQTELRCLEDAADCPLTFELDVLGTVLRRIGEGQAILIVHITGDERMEHDLKLARTTGRERRAGASVALYREGFGGDDTGKGDRVCSGFVGNDYR